MRTPPPTATPTTATTTQRRRRQSKTPEALFDPRAVTLLEAAIFSGALPQFKLDGNTQVDMRGMPPGVAEVYLLAVLNALQRRAGSLKHLSSPVTLLVPAYHPRDVFWPSYACRDEEEDRDAGMGVSTKGVEEAYEGGVQGSAGEATALGVAGVWVCECQRYVVCELWMIIIMIIIHHRNPAQLGYSIWRGRCCWEDCPAAQGTA